MKKLNSTGIYSNVFIRLNHPLTAELVSNLGFDMLTFDMQHGAIEYHNVAAMLPVLNKDLFTMARLPANDPALIMKLLDLGVQGLICPQVNSAEEATAFVQACYYPPQGNRSFGPLRAALKYENYSDKAANLVFPIVLIETKEGLANLHQICATPGLKGVYVGPYDLSLSLGLNSIADFNDPTLWNHIREIASVTRKHNLPCGIQTYQLEWVKPLHSLGYNIFGLMDEFQVMRSSLEKRGKEIKKEISKLI